MIFQEIVMEQRYTRSENYGLSQYDDSFDFDFDLQISAVEYVFYGIYLLLTVPFELLFKITSQFIQQRKEGTVPLDKASEDADLLQHELCEGPCCLWSRPSRD